MDEPVGVRSSSARPSVFSEKTKWLLRQLVVAELLIGGRETTRGASGASLPGRTEKPGKQVSVGFVRETRSRYKSPVADGCQTLVQLITIFPLLELRFSRR
jgi:hypothetical protein